MRVCNAISGLAWTSPRTRLSEIIQMAAKYGPGPLVLIMAPIDQGHSTEGTRYISVSDITAGVSIDDHFTGREQYRS